MATPSPIERWYRNRCDGNWEHQWGISIESLDNPGWRVKIDLQGTPAESKTLARDKIERGDENWIQYWAAEKKFEIACGPLNLSEALEIFAAWYASQS